MIEAKGKRDRPIKDWLIYEKVDGIRAVFKNGELISRYGNKFHAPPEFIEQIKWPISGSCHLDGELVHPEGLQKTGSIVRDKTKKNTMEYWQEIQYVVFDEMSMFTFDMRQLNIVQGLEENDNVKILKPLGQVSHISDIHTHLTAVEKKGGEGLILRNPGADYKYGRSWDLIKVKSFDDCEAEVIGHYPGEGKYDGMTGGLVCKLSNGIDFEVGTGLSDEVRKNPPSVGEVITIRYLGVTDSGRPRHAVYVDTRNYE